MRHLNLPMLRPECVIPHLAKQEKHWKAEHSAQELAVSWFKANGLPLAVRTVLDNCSIFRDAEFIDGFFEREVDLRTPGHNSQTDLMVVLGIRSELAVAAIEGKVEEPFGDLVRDWDNGSLGKAQRLQGLCATLGLDYRNVTDIRYQLLHRTASAIYEAQRYRAHRALMLVHSFSKAHSWFPDFQAFATAMNIPVDAPDALSGPKICEDVELYVGWVSDLPRR